MTALDGGDDAAAAVADSKWSLVQAPEARHGLRVRAALTLAQADTPKNASTPTSREFGDRSSYAIPALEIIGFDVLVNRLNNRFSGSDDYHVTAETIRNNLHGGWVTDNDPFSVNQFAHPYQGAMYHGFARSAGLGYWESSAYTFLGSALWEIAGERTPPSINDQVASGIAGSFFGEALFRMASLVLESGEGPTWWREICAALVSPPVGFNRLAFGERFSPIFSSHGAAYYSRLQLGFSRAVQGTERTDPDFKSNEFIADFSMQYGLPGKSDYEYTRPFDYFTFDATATTAGVFDAIGTRGLLVGTTYGRGDAGYRGVWGLYGSYDYIAPQTYRISTTALSIGTTAQLWLARTLALQTSALLGVGYGAVGDLRVRTEQDYHYGTTPQAVLLLGLVFDDRAALDVNARDFFVRGVSRGNDNIARADVSFTWRLYKHHAVSMKYLWNRRDSTTPILGSRAQTVATLGLFYTYVGREGFSAVDWRE